MNLIKQGPGQCRAAALAMAIGVSLEFVINTIGHNGSEIWWPNSEHPNNLRGFNPQELLEVAIGQGYAMLEIAHTTYSGGGDFPPRPVPFRQYPDGEARILHWMATSSGIIDGYVAADRPHCVAWDHKSRMIYDPFEPRSYDWDTDPNAIIVDTFYPIIRI